MSRFSSLAAWLDWQQTLHPKSIDLGLERVAKVAAALQLLTPACPVITVAGTNGKGSSIAMLDSILRAAGYRVGCYTSPHLLRYNERIRINGLEATDAQLLKAFAVVDQARADTSLSYFEFGTLAALQLFNHARLDVAVLETGLGGRLDAVNILDADVALITSIGIDHTDWLGEDRESIGAEKAGILRAHCPVICSDPRPPASVRDRARQLQATWYAPGEGYDWSRATRHWCWQSAARAYDVLPLPGLPGAHQLQNAAGVLMLLETQASSLPVSRAALEQGLSSVSLPGRCQQVEEGSVVTVYDVAHNPDSAGQLLALLDQSGDYPSTRVVLGMLADKDVAGFMTRLLPVAGHWYFADLPGTRALPARALGDVLCRLDPQQHARCFESVHAALAQARSDAAAGDRIVVCGSFITVAEALSCHV